MPRVDLAIRRLRNQHIGGRSFPTPADVVAHLGAVQAQDYLAALWAVGLRMREAVEADVERALAERRIVRTWPLRGTLHFVAAEDVRWMMELLAPRVLTQHARRLEREHELSEPVLQRCRASIERALRDGGQLSRADMYGALEKAGLATDRQRGLQILWRLAHERLICFGPRRGKQQTFVLLDEWLPASKPKPREEALGELARRYFRGHGPATVEDFAWWSGLTATDAKKAMEIAQLAHDSVDGQRYWFAGPAPRARSRPAAVHLLPAFDEFTVGYRDRGAILDPRFAKRVAGGGMISAVILVDGHVAGTWKRSLRGKSVQITTALFRSLTRTEKEALAEAAERYARFLG